MKKLNRKKLSSKTNTARATNMSVCNSCSSCGCGGSRCQSTCKGCHDKNGNVKKAKDAYK